MATYTEHYNLKKPALNDAVNINDINGNSDIIDATLYNKADKSDIEGLTASDVAYDNSGSGLTATSVQGAVDELRQADNIMMSDGVTSVEDVIDNMRLAKLWENPSPTSTFESQNINLSSSDYDMLLVNYKANKDDNRVLSQITLQTYGTDIFTTSPTTSSGAFVARRYISRINNTQFSVSDCSKLLSNTQSTDNDLCIPLTIYGIKLT